ncbi:MAG: hypothetical protein II881_05330 [Oscillospiraceae bacterium]|nr:hypothetical protein [Oscillospiraceae bacterium]
MGKERTAGLRLFLLSVLEMIADGRKVDKEFVERSLTSGICSELKLKINSELMGELSDESVNAVNDYYRYYIGCFDEKKYPLGKSDGLLWLIALALNEID